MDQRRRLTDLMLLEVLEAFREAGLLPRCYVVSSDRLALAFARRVGALAIEEPRDRGVNAAVLTGVRALGSIANFMVVPSDLPTLTAEEIKMAIDMKRTFDCVLTPSHSLDGTNLLLFSQRAMPALSYDSDSFWSHICGAGRKALTLAIYCGVGIMFDVDTPEDLRTLSVSRRRTPSAVFAKEVLHRRLS